MWALKQPRRDTPVAKTKVESGFTIIEVILVLAIAGLLFLAIFIALPALQRNQRDAQRKADMARLFALIEGHKADNQGKPFCNTQFTSFMADTFSARTARSMVIGSCGVSERRALQNDEAFSVLPTNHPTAPNAPYGYTGPQIDNAFMVATNKQWQSWDNYGSPTLHLGAQCGASAESPLFTAASSAGRYALAIKLEDGGYHCIDNS